MSHEAPHPRRPHLVSPTEETVRVVLAVKSFAVASHIGLGVTALNTMRVLRRAGIHAEVWTCQDSDDLVRRLRDHAFDPRPVTHVIVSAPSWVYPQTFAMLGLQYPDVEFVQLNHSGTAYLSIDKNGIANIRAVIALEQSTHNIRVAFNNTRGQLWAQEAFGQPILWLPNLYDTTTFVEPLPPRKLVYTSLKIGSFGASRPWKNQLTAAEAAVQLGRRLGVPIEFFINTGRPERLHGGHRLIESRAELFENLKGATVREVPWALWPDFRQVVRTMDILFSPSFDETFCVVAADGVAEGVPSVVTPAMEWLPPSWWCEPWDPSSVVGVAIRLLFDPMAIPEARRSLSTHVDQGTQSWVAYLGG